MIRTNIVIAFDDRRRLPTIDVESSRLATTVSSLLLYMINEYRFLNLMNRSTYTDVQRYASSVIHKMSHQCGAQSLLSNDRQ